MEYLKRLGSSERDSERSLTLQLKPIVTFRDCSYMESWRNSDIFIASQDLRAYCLLCECKVHKGHKFRMFRRGYGEYYVHEDCYDHHKGSQ